MFYRNNSACSNRKNFDENIGIKQIIGIKDAKQGHQQYEKQNIIAAILLLFYPFSRIST